MHELEEIFEQHAEWIRIYPATEIETNPREHTVTHVQLKNRNIEAIVTNLTFTQIQYKMPGISTSKAKEIVFKKKHKTLFEASYRIEIREEYFTGWRQNKRIQYKVIGDYIQAYVYKEQGM
jgi:hypothetical protein